MNGRLLICSYSAKTHVYKSTIKNVQHQLSLITPGKDWKDSVRSIPDSPRAVAELHLITGYDVLASHLYGIGIKACLLCSLYNENEVMDKFDLMLRPSLTKGIPNDRYCEARSRIGYCVL